MRNHKISQLPIVSDKGFVGSISEDDLANLYFEKKNLSTQTLEGVMKEAYPIVKESTPLDELSKLMTDNTNAVLVEMDNGKYQIITKFDIVQAIQI